MGLSKYLFNALQGYMGTRRMFNRSAESRRQELTIDLERLFHNTVQYGPFKGLTVPSATSWGDGDRAPKIIGSYEENLHPSILRAVDRSPVTIVNIGCAEGFYAVGFARLLPAATVFAFDIDARAGQVCCESAQANGVSERVVVGGLCTTEIIQNLAERPGRKLLFLDCEGAERELLDLEKVPGLVECDILLEVHDYCDPGLTDVLAERFKQSHDVEIIGQGSRNPNLLPELSKWPERDKWILIDENRPEAMQWLACWSRK